MSISWDAAGDTHRGRVRRRNEDAVRVEPVLGIFVVADGMGGHAAGNVASRLAADAALEVLSAQPNQDGISSLAQVFTRAHDSIVECCEKDDAMDGMGTTMTVAILSPNGDLRVGHIGDSRLYHVRDGHLWQLTHDHTWVQQEVDAGRLPRESGAAHPLSHILTRVLTADDSPEPDIHFQKVHPGETILLCSDGLYNMVDSALLLRLLSLNEPAESLVSRLVMAANEGGGTDNVTAIVVRIKQESGSGIQDSGMGQEGTNPEGSPEGKGQEAERTQDVGRTPPKPPPNLVRLPKR